LSHLFVPTRCGGWDRDACPKEAAVSVRQARWLNVLTALSTIVVMASAQEIHETDLKAVFLLRFGSFIEWPPSSGSAATGDFVIGVLGDDPVLPALESVTAGETVDGRPVRIDRYRGVFEVHDCQILFVSGTRRDRFRHILNRLHGRPILTVSDSDGFIEAGGMVAFLSDEGRVRLRVNVGSVRADGITISSKLLQLVEVVGDLPPGPSSDA